jgi:hypothetical protein
MWSVLRKHILKGGLLQGPSLREGPAEGEVREEEGNEDEELGGDEPAEDERSLFNLAGAGDKLIFTPQSLQAILGVVYRNLDRPMPPQIMNFPCRRTLLRYMVKYLWRRRKPDRQGPHRFSGSAPDFLELTIVVHLATSTCSYTY